MRGNWDKDRSSEGMKAKINRKRNVSSSRLDSGDSLDYLSVLFMLYFVSDPESESIRSPEPESESEQPHHDSAPCLSVWEGSVLVWQAFCPLNRTLHRPERARFWYEGLFSA